MTENNRSMPHSEALEHNILGACVHFADHLTVALEQITATDFYAGRSAELFGVLKRLARGGAVVEPLLVREACATSPNALALLDILPTWIGPDIAPLCVQLRELSAARRVTRAAFEIGSLGLECSADPTEFLDNASASLTTALQSREATATLSTAADVAYEIGYDLTQRTPEEATRAIPTGFRGLDQVLGGWEPCQLYVIAGRPGMGKTALAMQSVVAAAERGKRCAVYSLEMSEKQLAHRTLSGLARLNSRLVRPGILNRDQLERFLKQTQRFADLPIVMPKSTGIRIEEIVRSARQLKLRGGLDLVAVDYLQLLRSSGKHDSREQEVSEISRQLKEMSVALDLPVLALAQLNREAEKRGDKRPQPSDLRESGSIEQDADVIVFLFREDAYARGDQRLTGECELIISKNRYGETGYVKTLFEREYTRFSDLEQYS